MKSIWSALKPTLLELLGSKKALVTLSLIAVQAGASLLAWLHLGGWEVDQTAVDRVLAAGIAYVLGQSIVDHNSTAAAISAANPVPAAPTNMVVGELVTK